MKYTVYLTDPAENDLRLIHNYLSAVLQAPDTAAYQTTEENIEE